jgi:PAS domain S-box-containing protein
MSLKKPTLVEALGEISRLLNSYNDKGEILDHALNVLGLAISAQGVILVKKHFVNRENFILECLGFWCPPNKNVSPEAWEFELLKADGLPNEWWERLESHEIVFVKDPSIPGLCSFSTISFIPLFLEEHLFGFLAVWNVEDIDLFKFNQDFWWAVSHVFELWIARINIGKQVRDIIDFIPNPTFAIDVNGKITAWNPSNESLTGWKAGRILGKGDYEHAIPFYNERRPTVTNLIIKPDSQWEASYLDYRREGDTVFALGYCPNLPGGPAFLSAKTSRIYDINNRLCGAIHTMLDVTHVRQIEKKLHRSESMYRTITDFAGIGIALFRRDKILYYNEQFSKFLGISAREITLEDIINWVHPEDRNEISRSIEKLFTEVQEIRRFEFRSQKEDKVQYYSCYAQVIDYEDQPTIHFILDNITEQKELAYKARLHEIRMHHDDRLIALGTMAAGIAHELNQPLNTISVVTDGLLFGKDEGWDLDKEELFDNLEMISRQVSRMSEVIQNVRNFGREDLRQNLEEVNPSQAVINVFSMIGRQLEVHGVRVQKFLASNLPRIKANLNRLEQIILNLVVNSRQALDECQHDDKELWVRTGIRNGYVFIEVGDNAIGIPADIGRKIFDPFFTTKEVGKGTGLGLTISQSIVSEFNGRIEAFNNEKGGATFMVIFPACGEET